MGYRLIALDLDGTLLNSHKQITPRTREALRAARERGVVTVVATGRTVQSARHWSQLAGGGPVISTNGAAVMDPSGQIILTKPLPVGPLVRILQMGEQRRLLLECYTLDGMVLDRPLEQIRTYMRWVRPSKNVGAAMASLFTLWRINRIRAVRSLQRWANQPVFPPVLKLMIIGAPSELQALRRQIAKETPGLEVTASEANNLEVTAAGVNKGTALSQLASILHVPRGEIIAVGDSANDLEMLRYAGVGVAMANGIPAVQEVADWITTSCDEDGVAKVIEDLCLS